MAQHRLARAATLIQSARNDLELRGKELAAQHSNIMALLEKCRIKDDESYFEIAERVIARAIDHYENCPKI